jgi:SAM-dependent methyltransferase
VSQTDDKRPAKYHEVTRNWPPSPLLVEAVEHVARKGKAIDIGAGAFRDTRRLLAEGFAVTAIDRDAELAELAKTIDPQRLRFIPADFDCFDFPESEYDLACAMFALPFNPPQTFDRVFADIKRSLTTTASFVALCSGRTTPGAATAKRHFIRARGSKSQVSDLKLIALSRTNGTACRPWDRASTGMSSSSSRSRQGRRAGTNGRDHPERQYHKPKMTVVKFHELTKEAPSHGCSSARLNRLGRTGKTALAPARSGHTPFARRRLRRDGDRRCAGLVRSRKAIVSPSSASSPLRSTISIFPRRYDLASALYALPFNPPETFDRLFAGITRSLVSGGYFAAHSLARATN